MLITPPGRMRSSLVLPLLGFLCLVAYDIGRIQAQVTNPDEVSALQEIRNQLVDPLNNIRIWDQGDPCTSNWTGIVCYNVTADDGYLHIKELEFLNMNLSGSLSPQLGNLSSLKILDFMWNSITGSIPKEIGNLKSLELLLLNGNQLTGILPGELGFLPNLDRIQIDQNKISGSIPKSFAYLNKTRHFHMNNNSFSGQIPHELSRLPKLIHFLLDNNNLSGHLPPEFSEVPNLRILQLDNNHFEGTTIPASYGNMSKLLKLSLRNCGLQGQMPDLSKIPHLGYLDLSSNQLSGPLPTNKFSDDMITIILSNNSLTGNVSTAFAGLPRLQMLSLADNELDGSLSSAIWQNRNLTGAEKLILDFHNNKLSSIAGILNTPRNVTLMLQGNPLCSSANLVRYCGSNVDENDSQNTKNITFVCPDQACPPPYEYVPDYPVPCFCAVPLLVKYRLKSPGFSDFRPFLTDFEEYLSSGLNIYNYQLDLDTFIWQSGPRLRMLLKLFPLYNPVNNSHLFNASEVRRIHRIFIGWTIPDNDTFGPYELLDFILLDPYKDVLATPSRSGIGKGALAGIILGAIAVAVFLSAAVSILIHRTYARKLHGNITGHHRVSKIPINIDGLREFSYGEMALATYDFSDTVKVGQGGYGKVYRGVLDDGTVVAIKRAQVGSLQGEKEFYTEIQLLSRLHHRNLVSLLGICNEEGEQMLVYEFMPNGTLREHLSAKSKQPPSFAMRMKIALESAKGILYLHVDADPPIFHRDIKASNILLDSKFTAKVADFGLSRLAPIADMEGFVPSHVSTVVKGTPGYLDPEYLLTNQLTDKSDVYSLGVVFLELLTGMHPISFGKNIVREVNLARQSGTISSVIDQQMGPHPSECAERFMNLALKCCQDNTDARPPMIDVVRELEDISSMLDSDSGKTKSSAGRPVRHVSLATTSSSAGRDVSPATTRNFYVSSDVSGSDLVSGVIPAITPR